MQVFGKTDKGRTRKKNEDRIFYTDKPIGKLPNLFIVADGVGGNAAGEVASAFSTEKFCEYITEYTGNKSAIEILEDGIKEINKYIHYKSTNDYEFKGMATTFLAATIIEDKLHIINIGDCRLYLLDDKNITQVTQDNSYYNEMKNIIEVDMGRLNKNILSRAVGQLGKLKVDIYETQYKEGTRIIMCSDGLYKMLTELEMLEIVNESESAEESVENLMGIANEKGGKDNISVIVVK